MKEKSVTSNRSSKPGLLFWFGTGTGKILAASIVEKMTGFCYKQNNPNNKFGGYTFEKVHPASI